VAERPLWDSYNFVAAAVSKTYPRRGISPALARIASASLIPVLQLSRRSAGGPSALLKEDPMLDIVMLALGAGFFLAAIGYTYACERL
jgi:hypothetical protein